MRVFFKYRNQPILRLFRNKELTSLWFFIGKISSIHYMVPVTFHITPPWFHMKMFTRVKLLRWPSKLSNKHKPIQFSKSGTAINSYKSITILVLFSQLNRKYLSKYFIPILILFPRTNLPFSSLPHSWLRS